MKKILNFSLCILLALSLSLGNVAPVVNANRNDNYGKNEYHGGDGNPGQGKKPGQSENQDSKTYGHIDVTVTAQVTTIQKENGKQVSSQTVTANEKNVGMSTKSTSDPNRVVSEYQSINRNYSFNDNTDVMITCTLDVNGSEVQFKGSYKGSDTVCKGKGDAKGIDIDITSENINDTITHTVTFVDDNGVELSKQEGILHGTSATAPEDPTKEGYEFISWDKDFSNVKEDLTVTAQYKTLTTEETTEESTEEETTEEPTAVATATPTAVATASPTAIPTVKPTATPTSTPRFFLLKPNCTQPPERSSYPDANYVLVGSGELNINNGEIFGDDVKNYIISGPNEDSIKNTLSTGNTEAEAKLYDYLNNGWTVYWYVMKKEWDGWHVDGILVSPTPAVTTGSAVTPTAVATATPTDEVEPEPKETESAAPTETPVVTVTPSAVPTVTPNAVTGTATPVPSVTPGAVTGGAATATPGAVTGGAATATPGAVTATTAPTTTPGNNNPIIPNGNPVNPQNPPYSGNTTPTATPGASDTPSNGTDKEDGKEEDSDTNDSKEDSDTNDVNAGTTPTPSTDVEIKEDQIPGDASQATAVPSVEPSVTPTTEPTVTPTEKVEATANPDQKEDITVQDTTLPNTPPDSDEETDGNGNATEKDDAVEIEEDDIANSGAEVDEEDADQDAEAEDESEEDDESTDAEEVEEDEIANALPQTGVMSENVFYYIGSMICAFGICVLAFIRRKTMK